MLRVRMLAWSIAIVLMMTCPIAAQLAGGGGGAGGNSQNSSGIQIDSKGVMSLIVANDGAGTLDKKRREALAKKGASLDFNRRSNMRFVSLIELEKQIERSLVEQASIPNELFYLAGLQRLAFVYVYPEERDLVIAGPADGFVPDSVGRMIGVESGRPALRLDDLFIAMRTLLSSTQIGCSIDPVPERLAELQQFIRQGEPATIDVVEARFNQMDQILGLQDVRIDGVPPDSHFATALVEADYRMKRIAIGLETPRVKGLKSHLATTGTGGNTMQRWWFVPHYDSLSRSDDGNSFRFAGSRARLLTEEEVSDAKGIRSSSTTINKSAQTFARRFTEKFSELADNSPVFGELQNLIDWSILAALLSHERIPERIGWKQELFLDASRLNHPKFEVPKKVPSQVNYKRAGNVVVGQVCGGVVVFPQKTYESTIAVWQNSELSEGHKSASASRKHDIIRWWWDRGE